MSEPVHPMQQRTRMANHPNVPSSEPPTIVTTAPPIITTSPLPIITPAQGPTVSVERSAIVSPIGWSSIFAAAVVAIGAWIVLHMLGMSIGLITIDPNDASNLKKIGIGTGVWSLIAPIVALFIGGLVAGRLAPTINTANAVIHGAVVWALSVMAACFTLFTMMRVMPALLQPPPALGPTTTAGADAATQTLQVAEWTGKAMLAQVITALLALGAAVLGAFVTVRHERREHVMLPQTAHAM
jgi:hypothetical protein